MKLFNHIWRFQRRIGPVFRVIGISKDRRSKKQLASYAAIEQERADIALENRWRENIRQNAIKRLERKIAAGGY